MFTHPYLQLKHIAPEYYNGLMHHTSYTWVLWEFLTNPNMGPWSRITRTQRKGPLAPVMGAHPQGGGDRGAQDGERKSGGENSRVVKGGGVHRDVCHVDACATTATTRATTRRGVCE